MVSVAKVKFISHVLLIAPLSQSSADRRPIDPPPIVQLRVVDHATQGSPPSRSSPSSSQSFLQNPYYFMFASLASPDSDEELHLLKDGKTRCTTGSVVSSLYHLKDSENNGQDAGFFVFPDLSVRTEGSYRLKLSLFEVIGCVIRHFCTLHPVFLSSVLGSMCITASPSSQKHSMCTLRRNFREWKVNKTVAFIIDASLIICIRIDTTLLLSCRPRHQNSNPQGHSCSKTPGAGVSASPVTLAHAWSSWPLVTAADPAIKHWSH